MFQALESNDQLKHLSLANTGMWNIVVENIIYNELDEGGGGYGKVGL